jgi:hypothetical protein
MGLRLLLPAATLASNVLQTPSPAQPSGPPGTDIGTLSRLAVLPAGDAIAIVVTEPKR